MKNLFFQKDYLTLILSSRCNLNCSFCLVEKRNASLSFEGARKAVDFLLSLEGDSKKIKFFGGEPLLEAELLKKIVLYSEGKAAKINKKISFLLTTNGILLNADLLDFSKKHEIKLTLSSHHLGKIDKKIFNQLINFPGVCLNLDVLPQKVKNLYSDFIELCDLGFGKINILPAYYVSWPQKSLDIFAGELKRIESFISGKSEIHLLNSEFIGEVPLFNSCYTLDPKGDIYGSNIILFKNFERIKNFVFLGNLEQGPKIKEAEFSLKNLIEKNLEKRILKSTLAADEVLNDFIGRIGKKSISENSFKKADIKVGYSCNNHCLFCVQGRKRELYADKTTEEIKNIMRKAAKNCQAVVFTGGEPTSRPDFLELARYAKSLGFKRIQAQSNGRMFAYRNFCQQAVEAGVNEFGLALHGHVPELHNYLTSAESFYQVIQGIKNLKKMGQPVMTNTVITKSNYRHLPEIAKLLVSLDVDQFQFAFVHPLGAAQENFSSIVPRISLVMPYIKKGLDIGIKAGIKVMTEGIPYCLMGDYKDYVAEKIIPSTKIFEFETEVDFDKLRPALAKMKGNNCQKCVYSDACEGPWREYPEKLGFSEFTPIERKGEPVSRRLVKIMEQLIVENGLASKKEILIKTWQNLLNGFNPNWLNKNQKFDFSFSAKEKAEKSVRFSYNNYGEKENFRKKILDLFDTIGGNYDLLTLKKILDLMGKTDKKHQTTIGLEWLAGQEFPRVKLYFEELFHHYLPRELVKKTRNICNLINFKYNFLRLEKNPKIGVLCVDFLPNGDKNLKVSLKTENIDGKKLRDKFNFFQSPKHREYLGLFLKLLQKNVCFYYPTQRFNDNGGLLSFKLYKIYEAKQVNDLKPLIGEFIDFLAKIGFENGDLVNFIKLSQENSFLPYPVIFSLDFSKDKIKADSYFSLKENE